MAGMQAIEIADGDRTTVMLGTTIMKAADDLHGLS
jgi:hypothetical protein